MTKLSRIILGVDVPRETAVKRKERKRLSADFYRKRSAKSWVTRKRQKLAREVSARAEAEARTEAA